MYILSCFISALNCYSGWLHLVISVLNSFHQWSSSSIPHPNLTSQTWDMLIVVLLGQFWEHWWRKRVDWSGYWCVFFFFFSLPLWLTSCIRMGYHWSTSEAVPHYMVWGFDTNNYTEKTVHIFSIGCSVLFSNGGKVWKPGCRSIRF